MGDATDATRRWAAKLLTLTAAVAVMATSSPPRVDVVDHGDVRVTLTEAAPAAKVELVTTIGGTLRDVDAQQPPALELRVEDDAREVSATGEGLLVRTLITPLAGDGAPLADPVDVVGIQHRDPLAHCGEGACTQRYRVLLVREGRGEPLHVRLEARLAAEYDVYELPDGDVAFSLTMTPVDNP